MKYNVKKIPKHPKGISSSLADLVYIGKGTNPSIADTYNNGNKFLSLVVDSQFTDPVPTLDEYKGGCQNYHYFVPKDSSLLPKMFPLDEQQNNAKNPLLTTNELQFLATLNTNEFKPENHIKEIECIIIKLTNIQKEQSTSNANTLEQIIIKLRSVSESISTSQDTEIVL